jgi:hypothetical protein
MKGYGWAVYLAAARAGRKDGHLAASSAEMLVELSGAQMAVQMAVLMAGKWGMQTVPQWAACLAEHWAALTVAC